MLAYVQGNMSGHAYKTDERFAFFQYESLFLLGIEPGKFNNIAH
jgi:hypothetical protein